MASSRMLPDTFPAKAYLMIDNCSVEHPNVASWTADGTAFAVKDSAQLATDHLPRYFKHSNFQSFVRQLNIYGFRKDTAIPPGSREDVFRHDYFRQGREDLLESIKRTKKKPATRKCATAAAATKFVPASPSTTYSSSPPLSIDEWDDNQQPSLQLLHQQIAEMSAKIDILLSLATHQNNGNLSNGAAIGKKRRISGGVGYPSSEISIDSDNDREALDIDRSPRSNSFSRMDAVEEEKTADIEPIDLETAKQGEMVGAGIDGDELSEFIDNMLEEEGVAVLDNNIAEDDDISAIEGAQVQLGSNEIYGTSGTVFQSDAAATKIAPNVIEGEDQQPFSSSGNEATVDAVITQAERVDDEDDLERGETLVADAVPIWHYSGWHMPGGPSRRVRLAVLVFIVLLLIASIVVPSVVVVRNQEERRKRKPFPPPPGRPGGQGGGNGGPMAIAEAIADAIEAGDLPEEGPVAEALQDAIDAGIEAQNKKKETRGDGSGGDTEGRKQGGPIDEEKKAMFAQAFVKPDNILEGPTFNSTVAGHNITTTVDEVVYQCFPLVKT